MLSPGSAALGVIHAGAVLLALIAAGQVLRAGRGRTPALPGRVWLVVTLLSVVVWSAHLTWWCLLGASDAQVLWLPSVGASMGGLLAWSFAVLRPDRFGPRFSWAVMLVDPVLILAAHAVLGADVVSVRHDDRVEYGWFYGVHVLVTFAMMITTATLWIGSRTDPSRSLRTIGRVVLAGLLAAGVAQVLELMVLDIILTVTGAVVVVLCVRAGAGELQPRPRAGVLLDGLGALVLVFDRDDVLVDLNAPARAFFARRDGAVPDPGARAADLLPVRVDEALAGVEVRWRDVEGTIDLLCFAARLGPSVSPPHGAVVVLRRSGTEEQQLAAADADLALQLARRIDQLAGALGPAEPVVVLGLSFEHADDARRAAQAMEFVVGSLDVLVVDLVGESSLVAVAPARVEPYLVDVVAGWRPAADDARGEAVGRSVSLSPVLAGDRVVRHGPASGAAVLVAEVRRELAEGGL